MTTDILFNLFGRLVFACLTVAVCHVAALCNESMKLSLLLANTFYCWAIGLVCVYSILKMSFGV